MDAFAWIGHFVEWFGQWIPRWQVLEPSLAGVKFIEGGKRVTAQIGGIVYWWPARTKLSIYPVARQANDLRAQTILTRDSKTFVVGGMIVYEVEDVVKLLSQTYDPDDSIRDIALSVIHDVCVQHDSTTLLDAVRSGTLDKDLLHEARKGLTPYGVKVRKMTLTDLAPCRVLRLVTSVPTELGKAGT